MIPKLKHSVTVGFRPGLVGMKISPDCTSIKSLKKALRQLADPERAVVLQRFFKTGKGQYAEGDRFLGVVVPQSRRVATAYQTLDPLSLKELMGSPFHEERLIALFILVLQFNTASEPERKSIYQFYCRHLDHVNNWDLVDSSASQIVGTYLADKDVSPLYRWARAESLWHRRIAIVATFHFIRNQRFHETIEISEMLLQDKHDLIHKAVGWMLREVGKRDRAVLEVFLDQHCGHMPRTMLRYAIEHFPKKARDQYMGKR